MKDEIKEIIKGIKSYENEDLCLVVLSQQENKALLDYITNLQEKNNNLQEDFKRHIDRINELTERSDNLQEETERLHSVISDDEENLKLLQKENQRLLVELNKDMIERNNYLSRNEKAIEYIKSPRWKIDTHIEFNKQHLLNILQGDDKEC